MDANETLHRLRDRWTHLDAARRRSPCPSEVASIIVEQLRIEDELERLWQNI